jgi:hypothetical protein
MQKGKDRSIAAKESVNGVEKDEKARFTVARWLIEKIN